MFLGIESFGRQLFLSIFILVCTILAARLAFGWKSSSTREAAIFGILCLLVGLQYYYLLDVVTYIPSTRFFIYDSNLIRTECKKSGKGGKRIAGSMQSFDMNPCFCNSQVAVCIDSSGSIVTGACPIDEMHSCYYKNNGTKIEPYISSERNCRGGQGAKCTKDEPCYPCELDAIMAFGVDRCRTCATDFLGNCNFVEGVGPYCFVKPGSKKVRPCRQCCTEATPIVRNNTCF